VITRNELLLFISHSSADGVLAGRLVDLFEKALKLSARQIRCTSVNGYRLPVGADADEQLRREIFVAAAFVGVLTPSSARSTYVLFELGARWGAKRHLAPVLARGADAAVLGGPLSGLNALTLNDRGQTLQLVNDVAEYLELPLEPMAAFDAAINAVVSEANILAEPENLTVARTEPEPTEEEIRVLEFFAGKEEPTAREVATHLGVPEQKALFFIEELQSKSMVGSSGWTDRGFSYYLKQLGRAALVKRKLL
jgi:TIR domain